MTDIVERLRRSPYERELKDEAADTLEELRTENAKLREALEKTRAAIIQSAADTLWVGDIETAVDCIDAALNGDTK